MFIFIITSYVLLKDLFEIYKYFTRLYKDDSSTFAENLLGNFYVTEKTLL